MLVNPIPSGQDAGHTSVPSTQTNQSSPGCLRNFSKLFKYSSRNTAPAKWKKSLRTCSALFKRSTNKSEPGALSSFWKLPLELRQRCYRYAMEPDATPEYPYEEQVLVEYRTFFAPDGHPYCLPALCRVSKTLYKEAVPVFIANTIFRITAPSAAGVLAKFLETLPEDLGSRSVRILYIYVPDSHGVMAPDLPLTKNESMCPYIRLAQRCEGLRQVELLFWVDELVRWEDPALRSFHRGTLVPKTLDEMVQEYKLG
jgi:hypothetical protein